MDLRRSIHQMVFPTTSRKQIDMSKGNYIPWPAYMDLVITQRLYNERQRFYGKLRSDMKKRLRCQRWRHKHLNLPKPTQP